MPAYLLTAADAKMDEVYGDHVHVMNDGMFTNREYPR
jgi:hypothetical protein